ncbi:succinate dehydrogenase assembly factor 3, mitochondrial [Eurytemora carolleeae]|uniref:succinate dehydrogenase assembly factor 3, mitochondrial n=1 Tax=Eurytemora carolleeae TaxID=1294199 RepID=UPI000C772A57|nr:succinate dehydrogenase assembly factor 3, mitochondrial [Eurytemora carolleeae]|eukprot:XP_023328412.1 succinate dehydrogenase assembly factor 3, mitochondrial-like [Eurytemora affinis]
MSQLTHVNQVRLLYKSCLKLHRGLPLHLKAIGDTYVKDEFRRHKKVEPAQAKMFMEAWARYAIDLTKQMGIKGPHMAKKLGNQLGESDLENFTEEQIAQLYELYQVII